MLEPRNGGWICHQPGDPVRHPQFAAHLQIFASKVGDSDSGTLYSLHGRDDTRLGIQLKKQIFFHARLQHVEVRDSSCSVCLEETTGKHDPVLSPRDMYFGESRAFWANNLPKYVFAPNQSLTDLHRKVLTKPAYTFQPLTETTFDSDHGAVIEEQGPVSASISKSDCFELREETFQPPCVDGDGQTNDDKAGYSSLWTSGSYLRIRAASIQDGCASPSASALRRMWQSIIQRQTAIAKLEVLQLRCGLAFPSRGDSVDKSHDVRICPCNARDGCKGNTLDARKKGVRAAEQAQEVEDSSFRCKYTE
ncbi:hypothetical protein C8R46DRAFT_1034775 [Mycena filopes]|nr:hypothetical protein C8R46DRAFT_1034775 [Mycena filopes]